MNDTPATVYEAAHRIVAALEQAGLPYALGGALAYNYWGDPRGTKDLDLTVFVAEPQYDAVIDALRVAGCTVDRQEALTRARDRGDIRAEFSGMRVDVFVPSIPLYDSAQSRVRSVRFLERMVWVLAPEDLTVFKMLFHRGKDIEDIKRMLALQGAKFERDYVRRWLVELVGERDERVPEWDVLVRDYSGAS